MASLEIDPATSGPPLSESRLKSIESNLGLMFPRDFIEVLRRANGGTPLAKFFNHEGDEKVIDRFLSVVDNYKDHELGGYDIEVVWSQIEDRLSDSLIPFAALPNGDFLCFDFESNVTGPVVVLWDHERSFTDAPSVSVVAGSFAELVDKLRE